MSKRLAYTFRCTEPMRQSIEQVMRERNIDRTSVIKLSLYMLSTYMSRKEVRAMNLHELVKDIERMSPNQKRSFAEFSED
ncbi:MAG: hypothetical protein MJ051_07225 [Akkermansia sp.]|nr:hypothetical protein [Akkermansia sp.]